MYGNALTSSEAAWNLTLAQMMAFLYLLSDLCLFRRFVDLIYDAFPYTEEKCYNFICPWSPSSLSLPDVPYSFKQCIELCLV